MQPEQLFRKFDLLNASKLSISVISVGKTEQTVHKPLRTLLTQPFMRIRNFIASSAALLLAWLGITYFNDVPTESYPHQTRPRALSTTKVEISGEGKVATLDLQEIER